MDNQYNNVNSQSNGSGGYNQRHDLNGHSMTDNHGSSGHHRHHDLESQPIHSNAHHGDPGNLAGATVDDINRATHQQTDSPFAYGMDDLHTHDNKHHSSSSMSPGSGQFIGNSTVRTCPSHDLYQVESDESTQKARPTRHPITSSTDHHIPGYQYSNMSPIDRHIPENHLSNMSPTEDPHLPGGHQSSNTTSTSHPISGNNETSLLIKAEHLENRDGVSSISSTPSEYGSSDSNISPRQKPPVADKNAFIESNHTKKNWQHSMSPADRAKKLGAEMEEVLQTHKSPERKFLKIGENKEYKLD